MTSELLKFAKIRDDREFVWRIAAAMAIRAQETEAWDLDTNSRSLVNWVMTNPMVTPYAMFNQLAINTGIMAQVVFTESGAIDSSAVPDGDIQYVVNDKWAVAATSMFGVQRGSSPAPLTV